MITNERELEIVLFREPMKCIAHEDSDVKAFIKPSRRQLLPKYSYITTKNNKTTCIL